jgi:hypothetical protein
MCKIILVALIAAPLTVDALARLWIARAILSARKKHDELVDRINEISDKLRHG